MINDSHVIDWLFISTKKRTHPTTDIQGITKCLLCMTEEARKPKTLQYVGPTDQLRTPQHVRNTKRGKSLLRRSTLRY